MHVTPNTVPKAVNTERSRCGFTDITDSTITAADPTSQTDYSDIDVTYENSGESDCSMKSFVSVKQEVS